MARRHPRGFHLGSSTGDTIHTVLAPCPDSRRDGVDTEHYSMMKAGGLPWPWAPWFHFRRATGYGRPTLSPLDQSKIFVLAGFGHGGVGMFSYLDDDGGKKKNSMYDGMWKRKVEGKLLRKRRVTYMLQ